jgi:hypothetical protein
MKKILITSIILVIIVNAIFAWFVWQKRQSVPASTPTEVTGETPISLEEKLLTSDLDTSNLSAETKQEIDNLIKTQLADNERLLLLAKEANTTVDEFEVAQAYNRALYERGGEAGLSAYLQEIGTTDEIFRNELAEQNIIGKFLQEKAKPLVTLEKVRAYYDALPADQQDDFELMRYDIYDTLLAEAVAAVRTEVLATPQ